MPNPFDDFADLGGVEYIEPYSTHGETILHSLHRFHAWPKVVFIAPTDPVRVAYEARVEAEAQAEDDRCTGRDHRAEYDDAHRKIARVCAA